ncbi:MAG: hydroxymethylbilane synthase [Planctomycetes bacterium]|nr:hydroxymethylbilane synthase [Planctomycetota bacterium]
MAEKIIIGSRGSKLAMTQSNWVADELRSFHPGLEIEIVEIKTTGDTRLGASLTEIGGKGAFTKELEDALLAKRCDIAVHSLKDLPTNLPDGLRVTCTPRREVTDDALIYRTPIGTIDDDLEPLKYLPEGASVGTSSIRRKALLLAARPDVKIVEIRGNVDTRLRKLEELGLDAIILAAAGLSRLGILDVSPRPDRVDSRYDSLALKAPGWLPAVGQGALAIEAREDDERVAHLLAALHDAATFAATAAERAFLHRLGAGCQAPVAALATAPEGSTLKLRGRVMSLDGKTVVGTKAVGQIDKPDELGEQVAEWCLANGADGLL